jgi:outer membrane lipoprotein SlyB
MRWKTLSGLVAMLVLLPVFFASGAVRAQQYEPAYSVSAPRISGFDVEQVQRLVAGTELNFTLYGTPGGIAIISIPGAMGRLLLEEVETGLYAGTYTVKSRDQIMPDSRITANLRLGNLVSSVVLDESLIVSAPMTPARRMADAASSNPDPVIDRFDVVPNQLIAGSALVFTLYGSPGGKASVRIAGVTGRVFLDETRDGVYEGSYTIKTRDQVLPDSRVTANLRLGDRRSSAVLGKSLLAAAGVQPGARRGASNCANCGVVEAINVIEVKGDGSYLGMIAGGLAGALLGSQVGGGSGRTVATVAGAAGGAYAGSEIEKRMKQSRHYEVIMRLEGGGSQAVAYEAEPGFRVGDRVKVENGTLVRVQ